MNNKERDYDKLINFIENQQGLVCFLGTGGKAENIVWKASYEKMISRLEQIKEILEEEKNKPKIILKKLEINDDEWEETEKIFYYGYDKYKELKNGE